MVLELGFLFFARMADMTAATIRHLLVMRGRRFSAAALGFVEIVIYLAALGLILQEPHSLLRIAVFGLGYAAGIAAGCTIEEKLAVGSRLLQVTVDGDGHDLAAELRSNGCSVTSWRGEGLTGEKQVMNILVPRRKANSLMAMISARVPSAFVVNLEPRSHLGGLGPPLASGLEKGVPGLAGALLTTAAIACVSTENETGPGD